MERDLAGAGVGAPLQIMQSRGGVCSSAVARQRPVRLFLSGPAAGVVGGARGRAAGRPRRSDHGRYRRHQLRRRAGQRRHAAEPRPRVRSRAISVRVPTVDITTIGAGGGSIAWLDAGGALRVGPESAGSEPGPACYDRGGERGDGDRRLADPRLYRPGLFRRRLAAARAGAGARGRRADDRTAARHVGRGGGARDSPRPECPDGGGDPPRLDRPRHRPARLRAAATGRRRPAARLRAGPRTRHRPHRRADASRRALRRRPAVRADRARDIRRVPARFAGDCMAGSQGDARQPRCGSAAG